MNTENGDPTEYGLVMPFVVCESKDGPYDDLAYCAGWEAGAFDIALMIAPPLPGSEWIPEFPFREANRPQIDLIAMKHGLSVEWEEPADGWVNGRFRKWGKP